MKSNKLTRTEDFISSGCTTKSYFAQNQAILFTLTSLASQITSTITFGDCACKQSHDRSGLCHDAMRFVKRFVLAKRLRTNSQFVSPCLGLSDKGKPNDLRSTCLQVDVKRKKTRLKAFNKSLFYAPWANKSSCVGLTNRSAYALRFVRPSASLCTCTLKSKGVQINEHVTFSKFVPQELFLIQSIQHPCKSHYTIVRPLINCSRHTITMACIINRLPVYPDITNKKVRYSRNRIRKQVIPCLQFFFNPEIEKALFKFSEFHKTA